MQYFSVLWVSKYRVTISSLTDKRQLVAAPEALPALRRTPPVMEFEQSVTVARQTTAGIITSTVYNKN